MKEMRFGKSRLSTFLKSNGVFLALAGGLAAVACVALLGIDSAGKQPEKEPIDEPVEQVVTGQPDDRTTTTEEMESTTAITTNNQENQDTPDLYVLPLSNTVQKKFSLNAPIYSVTMNDWRIHSGTDFAGEIDQVVKAVAKGTVISIEDDELWGTIVTVDHGVGVQTRYCGVKASVQVDDKVDASTPIGTLDAIPCEAMQTPHLHFEMVVDGMPIDAVEAIGLEVRYADTLS